MAKQTPGILCLSASGYRLVPVGPRTQTHFLTFVQQSLYHLSHLPSLFFYVYVSLLKASMMV